MTDDRDQIDPPVENWIARNSKTISTLATVAIPVVLAVIGIIANSNINQQNLEKEYVDLAFSILQGDPDDADTSREAAISDAQQRCTAAEVDKIRDDPNVEDVAELSEELKSQRFANVESIALRTYALDLLIETTPVALSKAQYVALMCRRIDLPAITAEPSTTPSDDADVVKVLAAQAAEAQDRGEVAATASQDLIALLADDEVRTGPGCEMSVGEDAATTAGVPVPSGSYRVVAIRRSPNLGFAQPDLDSAEGGWLALSPAVTLVGDCGE